ncbi:MAG: hypothetical protein SWY16_05440 [Cyanobacteriota bacterium]|nr:hypothetical protein [Cyanobacteriota bacterium]
MKFFHRYRQVKNLLFRVVTPSKNINWVFIYGAPRSGTTYTFQQFLKIAKSGASDWELREFVRGITKIENSQQTWIDTDRLFYDFKQNILQNAAVGGGETFDFVVKQADATVDDFIFWKRLFQSEPKLILFLYREPLGWWSSLQEKFGMTETQGVNFYRSSFQRYDDLGGIVLEYGEAIPEYLHTLKEFENTELTPFRIKRDTFETAPPELAQYFDAFQSKLQVKNDRDN